MATNIGNTEVGGTKEGITNAITSYRENKRAEAFRAKNMKSTPQTPPGGYDSAGNPILATTRSGMNIIDATGKYARQDSFVKKATETPISGADLGTTQPTPNFPTAPTPAQTNVEVNNATTVANATTASQQAAEAQSAATQASATAQANAPAQTGFANNLADFLGLTKQFANKPNDVLAANEQFGVDQKLQTYNQIGAEITAADLNFRDKIKAAQKNPEGKLRGGVEAEVAQLEAERNDYLARASIRYDSARGDYESANKKATDYVDAKYDALDKQLQYTAAFIGMSKDDLSESEKLKLQNYYAEQQANNDMKRQKELYAWQQSIKTPGAPDPKNLGTSDNPIWGVWDSAKGTYVPLDMSTFGTAGGAADVKTSAVNQLDFLQKTANNAIALSGAAGTSGASRIIGDVLVGDTNYRRLESYVNTLKTNMLTLATDPNIKKFFGPQMSNADVELMTSAGTTLNTGKQSPEDLRAEVTRLQEVFTKLQNAARQAELNAKGYDQLAPDGKEIIFTD